MMDHAFHCPLRGTGTENLLVSRFVNCLSDDDFIPSMQFDESTVFLIQRIGKGFTNFCP